MDIDIATPTDLDAVVRLVNDAYRGSSKSPGWTHETELLSGHRIDVAALTAMTKQEGSSILVAKHDGDVVGCVALQSLGAGEWYLSMLAVDPDCQASGTGKAIMAGAEAWAHARGARMIKISVINLRGPLIAWYERRGYVRTGALEPFPYDDPSVGTPLRSDLALVTLTKSLYAG